MYEDARRYHLLPHISLSDTVYLVVTVFDVSCQHYEVYTLMLSLSVKRLLSLELRD